MNKKYLPHFVWALIAAGAFVVGLQANSESRNSSALTGGRSASPSQGLSSRQNSSDSISSSSRSRSRTARSNEISTSLSSLNLSAEEITRLGEEFRTARGPIARRLAFSELLKGLTAENAKLIREQIAHMPQDSPEFREFHYAWGSIAGKQAVTHGRDTPKRDMAATLAGWASSNPDAAVAYFNTLTPGEQNGASLMKWGAAFGLADADPYLATQFAADRLAGGDKDASKMMHIAAAAIFRGGDPKEAMTWASSLPEGPLRGEATSKVADEISKNDPQAALSWALSLSSGDGRNRAIGASFANWASQDPQAAAAEIASLSGAPRDAATFGYATRVVHEDPAAGVDWAATISDQSSREQALIDTGRTFFRKDPAGAAQWLAASGLSSELQEKIQRSK